jgi:hypothetical protein
MKIVFAIASPEFLRYYDSTMRYLADRGHSVSVAVSWLRERKHARMDLMEDERIETIGQVPKRGDWWSTYVRGVRATQDFLRYLHPRFANTPMLRQRVYRKVLPAIARPLNRFETLDGRTIDRGMRVLQRLERAAPVSRVVTDFVRDQRPDVVVVSPLIDAASDQVDLVRACQRTGIPVIAAIASWDNLTNKGHMRVYPDLVTVWNEHQRTEAIELHGVSPDRIRVTGAQLFDRWFERQPSLDRQAFCRQVGLPDDRPFVLFTGSSVFIARSDREVPFVRTWIEGMRASASPVLRDAAVLVRPHPFNPDAWITADFSDLGPVAVFPRERYTPAAEEARSSFFDSLYHCDAVVGINTSAMIEAAILRKPVLSLLTPEFAGTQEGTIHFRYLLPENGGFLRVANAVDAHLVQLDEVLRDPEATRAQTERFVQTFLRPHGLTVPCTPILADAIEQVARAGARPPVRDTVWARLARIVIFPLAVLAQMLDVEGGIRKRTWSLVYESYDFARKYGRLAVKRMVSRPRRAVSQVVILSSRAVRRWGRVSGRAMAGGLRRARRTGRLLMHRAMGVPRRVVRIARYAARLGRQLRYQVGLRLRGANGGVEGGDGQ